MCLCHVMSLHAYYYQEQEQGRWQHCPHTHTHTHTSLHLKLQPHWHLNQPASPLEPAIQPIENNQPAHGATGNHTHFLHSITPALL
jgi:hypothetical protein